MVPNGLRLRLRVGLGLVLALGLGLGLKLWFGVQIKLWTFYRDVGVFHPLRLELRIIAKEISHLFFAIDQVLKGTINSEMIGLFVKSRICYIEYCLFYPLEQLN